MKFGLERCGMKFAHVADLHIGKRVHDFSMLEDQRYILDQMLGIFVEQKVDGVLIAGDVYDKTVPSAEAVQLFDEWGFDGLVTTDWWTFGEHYRETKAGNDIKMAAGYPERVKEAYENGFISEEEIRLSARRILSVILRID